MCAYGIQTRTSDAGVPTTASHLINSREIKSFFFFVVGIHIADILFKKRRVFIEFRFILCLSKSFVHAGFITQVCCSVRLYPFTAIHTVAGQ